MASHKTLVVRRIFPSHSKEWGEEIKREILVKKKKQTKADCLCGVETHDGERRKGY